jgi:hypothetical protein
MAEEERAQPIFSSFAEDPALGEAIDAFAFALAERVDHLQDAEGAGELELLADRARSLARDAQAAGFGSLARLAELVQRAALQEKPEDLHIYLVDLTETARRIRLGHRGAL